MTMDTLIYEKVRVTPAGNVSRRDAAKYLGLSSKTLSEWAGKGLGPSPFKVGGRVFYHLSDLAAFASGS